VLSQCGKQTYFYPHINCSCLLQSNNA
jgi:hypothetical protein